MKTDKASKTNRPIHKCKDRKIQGRYTYSLSIYIYLHTHT